MLTQLPPLAELARRIAEQRLTPTEVVEFCLARVARFEDRARAWVVVDAEGARAEAARQTAALRAGAPAAPLAGATLAVKDIFDVAGLPTRAGSRFLGDAPAAESAPLVAELRRLGAIVLGKTVTTEFACFDPPPTRNPWNLARTPGGSSSGSAAALALGSCSLALGSQTGGSITRPASYCGVAGWKPTHGFFSLRGVVPVSPRLDHAGLLLRSADDLRSVWNAIAAGRTDVTARPPRRQHAAAEAPPRLGYWKAFFQEHAKPDAWAAFDAALRALRAAGAEARELPLPRGFERVRGWHRAIMAAEAAHTHREWFALHESAYGAKVAGLIREGRGVSAAEYLDALEGQALFQQAIDTLLGDLDACLTPATTDTAPDPSTTGDPAFNAPWSFAGAPTVNLPCGQGELGLPLGLQLVGARGQDAGVIEAARWCEAYLPRLGNPPLVESV